MLSLVVAMILTVFAMEYDPVYNILALPGGLEVVWDYCLENNIAMPGSYLPFIQMSTGLGVTSRGLSFDAMYPFNVMCGPRSTTALDVYNNRSVSGLTTGGWIGSGAISRCYKSRVCDPRIH